MQRAGFISAGKRLVNLEQGRAFHVLGFAVGLAVGDDAADEFLQLRARCEQRDGVVVALAHLAPVQAGQRGHVVFDGRLGRGEMRAVAVVEAGGHVARHFDVLHLVAPHRHLVRVEHQNVGTHQHRVHEQSNADIAVGVAARRGVFVYRRLVGVSTVEHAFAQHTAQKPGELWDFRNVGLAVKNDFVRVEATGQPTGGNFQRAALDARRIVNLDQRVVVGQKVKTLHTWAQAGLHRRANRAHVVAQMRRARGGDTGQKTFDGHGKKCKKWNSTHQHGQWGE